MARILPINQTKSSHLALMCSGNAARDEQGRTQGVNMVLTFEYICHRKVDGWMMNEWVIHPSSCLHGLGAVLGWGTGMTGALSRLTTSTGGADKKKAESKTQRRVEHAFHCHRSSQNT